MNTLIKNNKLLLIGFLVLFSLILNLTAQEENIKYNVEKSDTTTYIKLDSTLKVLALQDTIMTIGEKHPEIIEFQQESYDSLSANKDSIDNFGLLDSSITSITDTMQTDTMQTDTTQNVSIPEEITHDEIIDGIFQNQHLTKRENNYIAKLENKKKHRLRLITLDKSDIIFSRMARTPKSSLSNPANIGMKSETLINLSFLTGPLPNISFDISNSSFSLNTFNTYFNDGRLLTENELDDFVSLFKTDGFGLKTNIELPTIFSVKLPLTFSSVFINMGSYINLNGVLPGEVLAIPFQGNRTPGLSFNNPLTDGKSDFNTTAYNKITFGIGSFYTIPNIGNIELGNIRFGANINLYTGIYASVQGRNISINIDEDTGDSFSMDLILIAPLDALQFLDSESDTLLDEPIITEPADPNNIINIATGFDFGVGMRIRLNKYIPIEMPKFLKNDLDVQLSFNDIGAKINVGNMIQKRISISGNYLDPSNVDIDSILVLSETTIDSAYIHTEKIASKMNVTFTYQPIDQILIQTGFTSFLNEGIGYEDKGRLFISLNVFPVKWFFLNYKIEKRENDKHFQTGFGFRTRIWDASFYIHSVNQMGFVGYNFSESYFTASENIKGLGISFNSNWYF